MRKPSFVSSFKTALVVVPLLASCGGSVNSSPVVIVDPTNALQLPDCQEGQLIGVKDDGSYSCVTALTGMLAPPNCNPNTQVLTSLADSVTGKNVLSCVNKGTGAGDVTTTTRITSATNKVTDLQTSVALLTTGGGGRPKFVGTSAGMTNGQVLATVNAVQIQGATAAASLCFDNTKVAGAHLCSPMEIYESLVIGDLLNQTSTTYDNMQLMVYMQGWHLPFTDNTSEPTNGMNDNCGSQTYYTADRKWHNTVFTFAAPSGGGPKVAKFDNSQICNNQYKLACCK